METIQKNLENLFDSLLVESFPELSEELRTKSKEVTPSTQSRFGHYQFNGAMRIGKTLKQQPRQVAQTLLTALEARPEHASFAKCEIAGPGFINLTLSSSLLNEELNKASKDFSYLRPDLEEIERVVIDFSSPNTAKEMHVGHLRSTIIGDCLSRLFEFLGHDVLRLNHVGDWGTAFGMLIAHMRETAPKVLSGEQKAGLGDLVNWYRESKAHFDADPEFKTRSQKEVVRLQGGDELSLKAWKVICQISREAYQEIYDSLNVEIQERGESFYNDLLPELVKDLESKGLIEVSDGAKCIFLPGFKNRDGDPLPFMIQKSDGGYNYSTTDLAAIRQRIQVEGARRILYLTDAGQGTHFAMLFSAAEKAGYLNPQKVQVNHVPFGLVLGPDGKKFKTRSGESFKLIDLIHEAQEKALQILHEKRPELEESVALALSKKLGVAAIKYADLSCHRVGDYSFSLDRMLQFEGNTAVFLLYAYVRTQGILRKADPELLKGDGAGHIKLEHSSEVDLGLHLLRYPEILQLITRDLLPNRLCDFLFQLANLFNAFFRDCKVHGSEEEASRLRLCKLTADVLKSGLGILGIPTVDSM